MKKTIKILGLTILIFQSCVTSQKNKAKTSICNNKLQYDVIEWILENESFFFLEKESQKVEISDKISHWKPLNTSNNVTNDKLGINNLCSSCKSFCIDTITWKYKKILSSTKNTYFVSSNPNREENGVLYFSPIIKTQYANVVAIQYKFLSFDVNYYSFLLLRVRGQNRYVKIGDLEGITTHN